MAAMPASGGGAVATAPAAAARHTAAAAEALALEVAGLPHASDELAALLAHLRTMGRVITACAQPGGGSGGGSALVLLPPGTPPAAAAQLAAGGLLEGCPLDSRSLPVSLCSDPASWVQKVVGIQLPPMARGGDAQPAAPVHPQPLAAGSSEEQGPGETSPAAPVPCPTAHACGVGVVARGTHAGGGAAGGADACPRPSSPSSCDSLSHTGSDTPPAAPLRALGSSGSSGGSSASLAASSDTADPLPSPGNTSAAGSNSCLVVHNLAPYLSAWEVADFFSQFGQVVDCTKRPGTAIAFVSFAAAADAARAKDMTHYKVVPQLGLQEAISIQFRKRPPSRSSALAPFTCSRPSSRSRSEVGADSGAGSEAGGSEVGADSGAGSEAGGSEAGGSQEGSSEAVGSDAAGSEAAGGGRGEAGSAPPAAPPTPQLTNGGRALVVKNLPPSLPYEAVRVFFSQFGRLTSCFKQSQAPFAFVTYARPEAAAAALRSVNGTLCPPLNTASLIRVEFRRGLGARQPSMHSMQSMPAGGSAQGAPSGGSTAASSGSSAGSARSELSCHSESGCSEGGASMDRYGNGPLARQGGSSSLAFRTDSCVAPEGVAYPYPYPFTTVAFAYPCYLAPI